ncbi:histidine kinase [Microbacterium sediminicola]|uniref:histidine kinase n=1 Tax=Microbacterium sediminicola TaxID=415210 RepID=A0ABP4TS25_9MICO
MTVTPPPRLHTPAWVMDVVVVLVVALAGMVRPGTEVSERAPWEWIVALLPALFMLARRRAPLVVLGVSAACYVLLVGTSTATLLAPIPTGFAIYAVAVANERRMTVLATAVTTGVMIVPVSFVGGVYVWFAIFQLAATLAFAAALGSAVRTRRVFVEAVTARAERAERTREAEASRRVAEDRLRVARDLHDAVAHQIAVISLNAGVATSALDSRPQLAREALVTIRSASRQVLSEIGELLTSLREGESIRPGVDEIPALIERFRAAGLTVRVRSVGVPPSQAAAGPVAYTVVQEALTNAHKHGTSGQADVALHFTDREIDIVVTNPAHEHSSPDGSIALGLVGMRERVEQVGGTLEVSLRDQLFRVHARLPREEEPS